MRIAILGLGVIGTIYAYAFQKAGHQVEHVLRESKKSTAPNVLTVDLLDGRYVSKGENKQDTYVVHVAEDHAEYDFIFISVRHGFVKEAVETLRENRIKGTLVFFCNFWNTREEVEKWAGEYNYILAFPTAGGHMNKEHLDGVLFDHLMLEGEKKAHIPNYADLTDLLISADLKWPELCGRGAISVIVSGNGEDVTVFPVQENIHRNNILSKTIVPARISEGLAEKAKAMAVRIAEQLNLSGTLCVEMFATADNIIVNEIAPRPHNSGHYSIEACDFSQFDTHILGVLGAPLPAIHLHGPAVMLNVLGQHVEAAEKYVTENPSAHLHMYGKIEAKHNRKMGHVTLFSDEPDSVDEFGEGIDF